MAARSKANRSQSAKKGWQTRRKGGRRKENKNAAKAAALAVGTGMAINAYSQKKTGSRRVNPLFMGAAAGSITKVEHIRRRPVRY